MPSDGGAAASLVFRAGDPGAVAPPFWRCAAGLVPLLAARLLRPRPRTTPLPGPPHPLGGDRW